MTELARPAETLPEEIEAAIRNLTATRSMASAIVWNADLRTLRAAILAYAAQREAAARAAETAAQQRAERETREADCKAVCMYCRLEWPISGNGMDHVSTETPPCMVSCSAHQLRALASAEPAETTPTTGATDAAQ